MRQSEVGHSFADCVKRLESLYSNEEKEFFIGIKQTAPHRGFLLEPYYTVLGKTIHVLRSVIIIDNRSVHNELDSHTKMHTLFLCDTSVITSDHGWQILRVIGNEIDWTFDEANL